MIRTWTPESETPPDLPGTDYRTVKAWFQQCRTLTAAVDAQRQKLQRIRDIAERTTPGMSGMPGGAGGDKVGFAVEQLDTEERELRRMEKQLYALRVEAIRRAYLDAHDKTTLLQADCIRLFYVENKRQPQIVDTLHICENSEVSKLIRRGCERLAERWSEFE